MFTPQKHNIYHKVQMFDLLSAILRNSFLVESLMFKGGTYASLRRVLDRFSVDLDFDLPLRGKKDDVEGILYHIFKKLNLNIKAQSKNYLLFQLKYKAPEGARNTLKLEINDSPSKLNTYEKVKLSELNSYCNGHTIDTMVANKMLAAKGRFDKKGKISGRDFYDLNYFLRKGFKVNRSVVQDISKVSYKEYISQLINLVEKNLTERILNEDLNNLLPTSYLNKKLPRIKEELLFMLKQEI